MPAVRPGILLPLLLTSVALAQTPDAGTSPPKLPPLSPPLGRIGDVVTPVPEGGLPGEETVAIARFPGCDEDQAVWISRFLQMGAAGAGEQIQHWLDGQPEVHARLFGKARRPLAEAVERARRGTFHEGRACAMKAGVGQDLSLGAGARLTLDEAPPALCKLERGPAGGGGVWLFTQNPAGKVRRKDFSGAVRVAAAAGEGSDPCRPRLSGALFDGAGKTRLRYHADWGGAVAAEVLGDRCRALLLEFDPKARAFQATEITRKGCRPPSRR